MSRLQILTLERRDSRWRSSDQWEKPGDHCGRGVLDSFLVRNPDWQSHDSDGSNDHDASGVGIDPYVHSVRAKETTVEFFEFQSQLAIHVFHEYAARNLMWLKPIGPTTGKYNEPSARRAIAGMEFRNLSITDDRQDRHQIKRRRLPAY